MSRRHVMIMAAGTGGHIFPGLAVADELRRMGVEVSWLGTPEGMENRLVGKAGYRLESIAIKGLRGRGAAGWLMAPWRVLKATLQARRLIGKNRPLCVLSMGGYVAGPGGLAARSLRIPLVIHEQNAVAGLTNRLLRPLAKRVLTGFPDVLKKSEHVGNPVRADIAALPAPQARFAGRDGPLRLLVIGGSLGARRFGEVVPEALARLPDSVQVEVVHQAGRELELTRQSYRRAGVDGRVVDFIEDMAGAWAECDVALCRSGALTVAEIEAAGVAALLVPFPHAVDDHQYGNARHLESSGAAWLVRERDFDADWLAEKLAAMDRNTLEQMAGRARSLSMRDSAAAVARACLEVAA
ncbi:MAG TPA: undecaprenyldiphospho-muramoylpentapeptide beta-N-acetylglucosaminyltransferase [Wenzhouxiangella sp.]|nr:undecaprenyldiphospho-muramoylpentapeptide beta-N-acetylglucosaminyltransferase [Wenzhouxiangella sp.]